MYPGLYGYGPGTVYRDRRSADKKFKCDYEGCGLKYYNRGHLMRHQKKNHSLASGSDRKMFEENFGHSQTNVDEDGHVYATVDNDDMKTDTDQDCESSIKSLEKEYVGQYGTSNQEADLEQLEPSLSISCTNADNDEDRDSEDAYLNFKNNELGQNFKEVNDD